MLLQLSLFTTTLPCAVLLVVKFLHCEKSAVRWQGGAWSVSQEHAPLLLLFLVHNETLACSIPELRRMHMHDAFASPSEVRG